VIEAIAFCTAIGKLVELARASTDLPGRDQPLAAARVDPSLSLWERARVRDSLPRYRYRPDWVPVNKTSATTRPT